MEELGKKLHKFSNADKIL